MDQPSTKAQQLGDEDDARATWPDVEPAFELPRQRYVYAPPRPLPSACVHETVDMTPVRLAPEIDPRRAATILSLRPVQLQVLPDPPRQTSWAATTFGVVLLTALAVLPGTLVWWARTHRGLEPTSDMVAGAPSHGPLGPQPAVSGVRGKSRPAGPSASQGGPRVDPLRARPTASTAASSRQPVARLATRASQLRLDRRR
jgi:hypothetical protein